MTELTIDNHLDHQRWLMNRGLLNDLHKDTLFMYGSIVHTNVEAVHVKIVPEEKTVNYVIYVPKALLKKINEFLKLKKATSIFGLWKFKRMLKTEGNLDLGFIVDRFVKDYCGPKWKASVTIEDFANYRDGLEEEQIVNEESEEHSESDKQTDS